MLRLWAVSTLLRSWISLPPFLLKASDGQRTLLDITLMGKETQKPSALGCLLKGVSWLLKIMNKSVQQMKRLWEKWIWDIMATQEQSFHVHPTHSFVGLERATSYSIMPLKLGQWVDHSSVIAFHHISWLQQCRARAEQPNSWQEEGKEAVREGIGCHISRDPCNSMCVSTKTLPYSKDLVALGILPSWVIQVCPYILLPFNFSEGVQWQEQLISWQISVFL